MVVSGGLADTGAILALLDRDDDWHTACADAFGSLRLPLLTSSAVLTELFHLVSASHREVRAAWGFVRSGALRVSPVSDADLPTLHELMERYSDRPMDFADATLVHLAQREQLNLVFTIDHNDFETYRIGKRRRFRIVPPRSASG